jgi:tRNA threonylcarbamoyladenosine biosynthesis protein TsaB
MLVLALDTTTPAGSVALANRGTVLEVMAIDPSQPVATRLPGDLAALLDRHHVRVDDIALFAVATGPGSFTGLRIGIASMQGLAVATGQPLVGVSSFQALATFANASRVGVWIDAWRGEVYGALLACEEGAPPHEIGSALVAPPEALLGEVGAAEATVFVGDGAVKYRDRLRQRVVEPTPLIAGAVARLAWDRFEAGEAPPPHAIRPLYVRRPDAELARERSGG